MPFQLGPYDSCGFCRYVVREVECAVLAENDLAIALVNPRQYERGAALVIPKRHCETILDVSETELASIYILAKGLARAAEVALGACDANVFQNNGIQAGQHVPHMHVHVVPRYPNSAPERLFLQRDFPVIAMAEQKTIAAAVRAAL
jgi:histidine triad (HIT) family protein